MNREFNRPSPPLCESPFRTVKGEGRKRKISEQIWHRIIKTLARREKVHIIRPGLKQSAVLMPLFQKEGETYLLFTQRTQNVVNHKGQISFPGGTFEEEDVTLKTTAVREGQEEIGLKEKDILLLGELDDVETVVTGFKIRPYVVAIPYPYSFEVNKEEVEKLIELPLEAFLDSSGFHDSSKDGPVPGYYFKVEDKIIWGATAKILINFLNLIFPTEAKFLPR